MRLYLVRHGQTSWNAAGRAQGHTDIELDETGLLQADRLEAAFRHIHVERVISSDLIRAKRTAQAIVNASGAAFEQRVDLRERGFGNWEGDSFTAVGVRMEHLSREQGIGRHEVRPPGGESFSDVWHRLQRVTEEIFTLREDTAIVSHGGTCSLLLAQLLKGTVETSRGFRFANTGITELHRRPEGLFLMVRYNDSRHLEGMETLQGSLDGVSRS